MSSTIRISNIPKDATLESLNPLFLSFGNVLATDKLPGHTAIKIQYQEIEDAQNAIDNLDGYLIDGNYLKVTRVNESHKLD